jgi:hypothetical protein
MVAKLANKIIFSRLAIIEFFEGYVIILIGI